jgi:hypothetical protein
MDSVGAQAAPDDDPRGRTKWTWGSSAIAQAGGTTVEIDEAIEADVWKLSINVPGCYISVELDGDIQRDELTRFLSGANTGEFRLGPPWTTWVWDDETPGRLFVWVNRASKHAMCAELSPEQVDCVRSALAEATKGA